MPPSLFPKSPELDGSSAEQKRAEILAYFLATFNRYETLFEVLQSDAAYYKKPIALRHPLIFILVTEHTQRADWIGGFKKDGENFTTLDGLKKILSPHFALRCEPIELPFVIRETKRKFQHTYAEVSVWEKTATCPPLQKP